MAGEIDTGVYHPQYVDGIHLNKVHKLVADSPHGEVLRQNARYGVFKPQDMPTAEWVRLIGVDGNNLLHMRLTRSIAQSMTHYSDNPHEGWIGQVPDDARFSRDEKELLHLTADIHDVAEAIVGDMPEPLKTARDTEKEVVVLQEMLSEMFAADPYNVLLPRLRLAIDVIGDKDSKLGRAFNTIERVGYLRTTIKAWRASRLQEGENRLALASLAQQVYSRQYPHVLERGSIYPGAHHFITTPRNRESLAEIAQDIKDNPLPNPFAQ